MLILKFMRQTKGQEIDHSQGVEGGRCTPTRGQEFVQNYYKKTKYKHTEKQSKIKKLKHSIYNKGVIPDY